MDMDKPMSMMQGRETSGASRAMTMDENASMKRSEQGAYTDNVVGCTMEKIDKPMDMAMPMKRDEQTSDMNNAMDKDMETEGYEGHEGYGRYERY
jgi:hypothetical protein